PAHATGAEPSPPAGEADQALRTAMIAEGAAEAVLEDAAGEEGLQLLAHKRGHGAVVGVGVGEEGVEVLVEDLVERALRYLARPVLQRYPHGGGPWCTLRAGDSSSRNRHLEAVSVGRRTMGRDVAATGPGTGARRQVRPPERWSWTRCTWRQRAPAAAPSTWRCVPSTSARRD